MAWSNVTAYLVGSNLGSTNVTATLTLSTSDYPDAQTAIQNMLKSGGFWGSNGFFYPTSAIIAVQVQ